MAVLVASAGLLGFESSSAPYLAKAPRPAGVCSQVQLTHQKTSVICTNSFCARSVEVCGIRYSSELTFEGRSAAPRNQFPAPAPDFLLSAGSLYVRPSGRRWMVSPIFICDTRRSVRARLNSRYGRPRRTGRRGGSAAVRPGRRVRPVSEVRCQLRVAVGLERHHDGCGSFVNGGSVFLGVEAVDQASTPWMLELDRHRFTPRTVLPPCRA